MSFLFAFKKLLSNSKNLSIQLSSLKRCTQNLVAKFIVPDWGDKVNYDITSGFWPRVRARALRAPVF
jgi:hypothetical protein